MPIPYRDRVRVLYRAEAVGEEDPDWEVLRDHESVLCNIIGAKGGETNRGEQVEAHVKHKVEMRLRPDITEDMRLYVLTGYISGRTLQIDSLVVVDRREQGRLPELYLYCTDEGNVTSESDGS